MPLGCTAAAVLPNQDSGTSRILVNSTLKLTWSVKYLRHTPSAARHRLHIVRDGLLVQGPPARQEPERLDPHQGAPTVR